ncbi:hypothetical protein [Pectobacterium zantedeschiae]|uniref:Uncharacterized protein n=1 Tax=Pectobacterium zantedeschiae TaxID=2034769 RepID=A0A9X8JE34_9GAMM|nr:hypothetical protein [Pectobacterium zantedeschiae]RYC38847.1 hypothetical protein CLR69_21570 [Pectobacterium zantedeschiae]
MKYSYRVAKYRSIDDGGNPHSSPDEWTSFFDVGDKVDIDEYHRVENQYIDFISEACSFFSVNELRLKDLELNGDVNYSDNQKIKLNFIEGVVKSVLREEVWCKLVSDSIEFHFGYDFYIYFLSRNNPESFIKKLNSPLTVQEYISPYI